MIVLESERLLFRQHTPVDLEDFCAMEMDADVRRYAGGSPRSREDADRKFGAGPLKLALDRLGVWATILKPNGPYIGRCGLYPHFLSDGRIAMGEAALSFYIARNFWGRGFASEAAAAFVRFGWEDLNLSRIVATVQEGNDASIHILRKLQFNLIATERGPRSFFKYALTRPPTEVARERPIELV